MKTIRLFQVDAFTDEPFAGNPAAVCLLTQPRDETWMQRVAMEMNLSETAFPAPEGEGFHLRWFTPAAEVEMCGHATLATAHVLWEEGIAAAGATIRFRTLSGELRASRRDGFVELDFPATPPGEPITSPGLAEALGAAPVEIRQSRFDELAVFEREGDVRALRPDFRALGALQARGVIATAPSNDQRFAFVSRFFAPAVGIDEDPVTGSAHCCLGPYWGTRLGRTELVGFQASTRGGVVTVRLAGDRVMFGGSAVTVLRGELLV